MRDLDSAKYNQEPKEWYDEEFPGESLAGRGDWCLWLVIAGFMVVGLGIGIALQAIF